MFGSTTSGFGGFNTQSNSGTSPFGGGTVAATNSAFPPSNSGVFGALNTNSVFGQNTNTTSAFSASPGTSAFGLGSAGGTSAFGQPSNSAFGRGSSVFGQTTQNNTSPFGAVSNSPSTTSGSNIFGGLSKPFGSTFGTPQNNSITPFGGAASGSSMFGSSVDVNVNNGTAGKPFSEVIDKDAQGVSKFQNIAAMPEYKNFSVEELRLKDYEQNRRFGNSTAPNTVFGASPGSNTGIFGNNNSAFGNAGTSAFGQNNTTGAFGQSNNTGAFGSSGIFGSGNNASTGTLAFGANNTTSGGFGSAFGNTNSAFGANKPSAFGSSLGNTGAFGSNNNTTTSAFGSSLNNNASPFGQSNNNTSTFGATNNSPFSNNTGGGIFGNNNNVGTSAFGSNNTAKPGGLFGTSNNAFGSNNSANNSGGLFGNSSLAFGAKPAADGLFGSNNNAQPSAFGQNTQSGGLFGQSNNNATNNSGGLFAQNNYQSGGFFGQNNNNNSGGLFGNNNQANNTSVGLFENANNNNTSGGLFGNKPAAPSGGLFANTGTNTTSGFGSTQNNTTSGGLFGKPTGTAGTGGGLFGNTNTNSTPAASGGLFGANNTNNSTGGGFFGNLNATAGTNTQSGGLFGNKPATTTGTVGGGLFGNTQNSTATNNTTGTSLFGGSSLFGGQPQQNQQQQQPQAQQPLLLLSQAGQLLLPLVCGPMPSLLTRDPYGSSQLFESIAGANSDANVPRAIAVSKVKKKYNLSSVHRLEPLFKAKTFNAPTEEMKMEVFSAGNADTSKISSANNVIDQAIMSSALFAPKLDYKKLVLNSTMEPQKLIAGAEELSPKRVLFALTKTEPPEQEAPLRVEASSEEEIDDDGYWTSPALSQLKKMSLAHLRKVKDFTVGRKYYGQVRFREPVDLSAINLDDICGNIVVFGSKNVIIYPDDDPPKVGEGLNLPAEVTLEGCYPTNKKTKLATLDPKDEVVKRHIQQLKELPDIEFKNYDPPSGDWTFKFEHL